MKALLQSAMKYVFRRGQAYKVDDNSMEKEEYIDDKHCDASFATKSFSDRVAEKIVSSANSHVKHSYTNNERDIHRLQKQKHKNIYANRYIDTSKRFRGFWHLMLKWKGSVFKLIWHDLLVFLAIYMSLMLMYRFVLTQYDDVVIYKEYFELVCVYCSRFKGAIPITFLTGFYVTEVVRRYWDQFMNLPFPDRIALKLVSYIPGKDAFRCNLRRTVMRYVNLSIVLVFRLVSAKVHARFPDYQSLVNAKLMLPTEAERMRRAEALTPHEATWTPVLWALKLLERARTENKIKMEAPIYSNLVSTFEYIEINNRKILNHGWVNFPLAYTQVATLAVFSYFFASLFGSQYLTPPESQLNYHAFPHTNISFSTEEPYDQHTPDVYVPYFTVLEFISYMGWIKVAETLLNPFGDDDEDFEINYLIDRNVQVSYMIVDDADMEMELAKDPFLEAGIPIPPELPYQDESQREESARRVVGENEEAPKLRRAASRIRKISQAFGSNRNSANLDLAKIRKQSIGNISVRSARASIVETGGQLRKTGSYPYIEPITEATIEELRTPRISRQQDEGIVLHTLQGYKEHEVVEIESAPETGRESAKSSTSSYGRQDSGINSSESETSVQSFKELLKNNVMFATTDTNTTKSDDTNTFQEMVKSSASFGKGDRKRAQEYLTKRRHSAFRNFVFGETEVPHTKIHKVEIAKY